MHRAVLIVSVLLAASPVGAQTPGSKGERWTAPRTPDGRPDLQGIWTTQTFTPLQRPDRFAGQEFLTQEEAAELTEVLTAQGVDPLRGGAFAQALAEDDAEQRRNTTVQTDPTHYDNAMWLRTVRPKGLSSRRTSLIVDPPDGRIPPRTPVGQERAAAQLELRGYDSYANRPLQERCLVWAHEGPPMVPPPYNDIYQIFQIPGYVALFPEMANNPVRIIRTDGGGHLPAGVRQWSGDSTGRWEGDTLVVDTTNFTDRTAFRGSGEALHVGRALHPRRCRHDPVRVHGRRPDDMGSLLERGDPDGEDRRPAPRVHLPRRELRHAEHPQGCSRGRQARGGRSRPVVHFVVRVINTATHRWCSYECDLFAVRSGARVGGLRRREPDGAAWRSPG